MEKSCINVDSSSATHLFLIEGSAFSEKRARKLCVRFTHSLGIEVCALLLNNTKDIKFNIDKIEARK